VAGTGVSAGIVPRVDNPTRPALFRGIREPPRSVEVVARTVTVMAPIMALARLRDRGG